MKDKKTNLKLVLDHVKTIAIVGASDKSDRDSYKVMKSLIENGYDVIPINPNETGKIILGRACLSSLQEIKYRVDMVDIFRAHDAILGITKESIKIGAKVLWMQEGIIHNEDSELAKNAGLKVVMNRCPKKELFKPYWTTKRK